MYNEKMKMTRIWKAWMRCDENREGFCLENREGLWTEKVFGS
jgi:hypothetical protein